MASQEEKVAPPEGQDDNAEFSGAWDELKAEEEGQSAPAAEHPQNDAGDEDQGEDEAGQAAQEGGPPGADADEASRNEITDDVLASADPAVRAYVERVQTEKQKAENLARANGGRLAQALNQLHALQESLGSKRDEDSATEEGAEAATREERLVQLREEYPEVAGPLLDKMATLEATVKTLMGAEQARASTSYSEALDQQKEWFESRHPDLPTIVADPRYAEWLQAQTPAIQRIVEENSQAIVNAADAALVFDLFKRDIGYGREAQPDPAAESAAQRRQRQLEAGRSATGSQPGVRSDAAQEGTFEEEWDRLEMAEKRKRAAGRR